MADVKAAANSVINDQDHALAAIGLRLGVFTSFPITTGSVVTRPCWVSDRGRGVDEL
jgi:hypothetical protein